MRAADAKQYVGRRVVVSGDGLAVGCNGTLTADRVTRDALILGGRLGSLVVPLRAIRTITAFVEDDPWNGRTR